MSDLGDKIKGKLEQVEGDFEQWRGQGVKGGLRKMKGKIREEVADTRMKSKEEVRKEKTRVDERNDNW